MEVRNARETEVEHLAQLWYDGWQDAHAPLMPKELARLRTLESFADRLRGKLTDIRVMGPVGAPLGFAIVKADELYQLYVSAEARGTGVAAALIADAEARLARAGIETAWLGCAIGNDRAARFYEKCGWRQAGAVTIDVDTSEGPFPLKVWRYEKRLC
jgi:GNAT superfamily N-acetyltransferase